MGTFTKPCDGNRSSLTAIMKFVAICFVLYTSGAFAVLLNDKLTVVKQNGGRIEKADNYDDASVEAICGKADMVMLGCKCILGNPDKLDKRACDGAWVEEREVSSLNDPSSTCVTTANAQSESFLQAQAMCQRLLVFAYEPPQQGGGGSSLAPNPTVTCPDEYILLNCHMHADRMDEMFWPRSIGVKLTKNFETHTCSITNCNACRVQASCFRAGVEAQFSLDTFA